MFIKNSLQQQKVRKWKETTIYTTQFINEGQSKNQEQIQRDLFFNFFMFKNLFHIKRQTWRIVPAATVRAVDTETGTVFQFQFQLWPETVPS